MCPNGTILYSVYNQVDLMEKAIYEFSTSTYRLTGTAEFIEDNDSPIVKFTVRKDMISNPGVEPPTTCDGRYGRNFNTKSCEGSRSGRSMLVTCP